MNVIRTGRDLAAERVRASLRMCDVASAMGISKSRVFILEHSDHVTAQMAARYLGAIREEKMKPPPESTATASEGATDGAITGHLQQQG